MQSPVDDISSCVYHGHCPHEGNAAVTRTWTTQYLYDLANLFDLSEIPFSHSCNGDATQLSLRAELYGLTMSSMQDKKNSIKAIFYEYYLIK